MSSSIDLALAQLFARPSSARSSASFFHAAWKFPANAAFHPTAL
jgi:hypothetical protein